MAEKPYGPMAMKRLLLYVKIHQILDKAKIYLVPWIIRNWVYINIWTLKKICFKLGQMLPQLQYYNYTFSLSVEYFLFY